MTFYVVTYAWRGTNESEAVFSDEGLAFKFAREVLPPGRGWVRVDRYVVAVVDL